MTDLHEIERQSIARFIQDAIADGYLGGRVLDYGCGRQPYRDLIEAAGSIYVGYDETRFPANVSGRDITEGVFEGEFDAVLCTQVIQYVWDAQAFLYALREWLYDGGHLVMTYPTHWPEIEADDLHRWTRAGMEKVLAATGFRIVRHDRRADLRHAGTSFALGYGVIAQV